MPSPAGRDEEQDEGGMRAAKRKQDEQGMSTSKLRKLVSAELRSNFDLGECRHAAEWQSQGCPGASDFLASIGLQQLAAVDWARQRLHPLVRSFIRNFNTSKSTTIVAAKPIVFNCDLVASTLGISAEGFEAPDKYRPSVQPLEFFKPASYRGSGFRNSFAIDPTVGKLFNVLAEVVEMTNESADTTSPQLLSLVQLARQGKAVNWAHFMVHQFQAFIKQVRRENGRQVFRAVPLIASILEKLGFQEGQAARSKAVSRPAEDSMSAGEIPAQCSKEGVETSSRSLAQCNELSNKEGVDESCSRRGETPVEQQAATEVGVPEAAPEANRKEEKLAEASQGALPQPDEMLVEELQVATQVSPEANQKEEKLAEAGEGARSQQDEMLVEELQATTQVVPAANQESKKLCRNEERPPDVIVISDDEDAEEERFFKVANGGSIEVVDLTEEEEELLPHSRSLLEKLKAENMKLKERLSLEMEARRLEAEAWHEIVLHGLQRREQVSASQQRF